MPSTTNDNNRKLPNPVYAAAGAGELAIERLRSLPSRFSELRDRAKLEERFAGVREDLREAGRKVRELDADKLKELRDNATVAAAKAQERAKETYAELVTRGERVASGERSPIRVIATIAKPQAEKAERAETPVAEPVAKTAKAAPKKPAAKRTTKKV